METTLGGALASLSADIAATVERVAANLVAFEARDRIGSSGFFIAANTIVTADHAIDNDDIDVVYADGRTERATLTGRDPRPTSRSYTLRPPAQHRSVTPRAAR